MKLVQLLLLNKADVDKTCKVHTCMNISIEMSPSEHFQVRLMWVCLWLKIACSWLCQIHPFWNICYNHRQHYRLCTKSWRYVLFTFGYLCEFVIVNVIKNGKKCIVPNSSFLTMLFVCLCLSEIVNSFRMAPLHYTYQQKTGAKGWRSCLLQMGPM